MREREQSSRTKAAIIGKSNMRHGTLRNLLRVVVNMWMVTAICGVLITDVLAQGSPVWQPVPLTTQKQKDAGLLGGEGMQAIYGIKYAPSNPNILYIIIDTTGPWKSTDGGTSWKPIFNGFNSGGAISVGVHPTNPAIVFVAGSDMGNLTWGGRLAIYKTIDGGVTWTNVRNNTKFYREGNSRGADLFLFSGTNTVYAGTHGDGLLKSTDGGTTWSTVISGHYIYDLAKAPNGALYMTTKTGLYRINSDFSTQLINSGLPANPGQIEISATDNNIAYVTVGTYGVYKTTNLGSATPTFSAVNNGMSGTVGTYVAQPIALSPVDHNYLFVSYKRSGTSAPWGFFYTKNGGASWLVPTTMDLNNLGSDNSWGNQEIGHPYSTPISFHPTDKNIAFATTGAEQPRKTTDGGVTWIYSGSGKMGGLLSGWNPIGFDTTDPKRHMFFLADFGPYLTEDGGSTFLGRPAPFVFGVVPGTTTKWSGWGSTAGGDIEPGANPQVVVSATGTWEWQKIIVSRNKGASWTVIETPDTTAQYDHNLISFHPTNSNIIYAGQFRSTDKGYTWTKLSMDIVGMYRKNGNIMYSVRGSGGTSMIVHKSMDNGTTWTTPYRPIPATGQVGRIAIAPNDPDRIYVPLKGATPTNQAGIWIVTPSSATLRNNAHGLDTDHQSPGQMNYWNVATDPNNPNVVYAGQWVGAGMSAGSGISRSVDYGNTWTNVSGNLTPWFITNTMTVNPHDSYLYIGTFAGTWKLPPPGTSNTDAIAPSGSLSINNGAASTSSSNVNLNLSATDSVGVTAYYVANSSTPPQANSSGWVGVSSSTSFSKAVSHALTAGAGIKTVYAWYKDAAGNVSNTAFDAIEVLADSALSVSANKTLSPVNINGSLSESVWSFSQTLNKTISGTNNNTTTFGVLWDNTYLYVGIKVLDSNLLNDSTDPWLDDSIEVYIDGKHEHSSSYDANDRQFVKGYNDTALAALQNGTGVLHGTANIAGGYTVELAIPWSNLGVTPLADMVVGFDIQNNDDDDGSGRDGAKDWNSSQDINYTSTVNFGHLTLSSTTVGSIDTTAPNAPTGLKVMQ